MLHPIITPVSDLFISYARADRDRIEPLAKALEREGFSVWWDRRISGGAEFTREIQARLDEARVVLVAWSAESVESHWAAERQHTGSWEGFGLGPNQEALEAIYLGAFGDAAQRQVGVNTLEAVAARRAPNAPHRILPTLYGYFGERDKALALFYIRPDTADEVPHTGPAVYSIFSL